ncbi:MAG: hypothetical protein ACXADB_07835 [Candidatus Hermodarchaeia archaeon]|jgi:hypothetical protein
MKKLIKVGFWSGNGEYNDKYRDVKDHIDTGWSPLIKEAVLMHLRAGKTDNHQKGWSDCRVCGKMNGSTEQTDGTYIWPDGFAHYIIEHNVKPPQEFIDHVIRCASEDD